MTVRLHITIPEQGEQNFELLDNSEHTLGRGADCTVRILHGTLSSRHASIRVFGGHLEVRDDESRFGTQIDTVRLQPGNWHAVRSGQQLWLGDVMLVWSPVDDDRTVALDLDSGVSAAPADDSALWSVAIDRDSPPKAASASVEREVESASSSLSSGEPQPVSATAPIAAASPRPTELPVTPEAAPAKPSRAQRAAARRAHDPRPPLRVGRVTLAAFAAATCLASFAFAVWVAFG